MKICVMCDKQIFSLVEREKQTKIEIKVFIHLTWHSESSEFININGETYNYNLLLIIIK